MTLEIQVLAWDMHKNMAGLNRLIGSESSTLDNLVIHVFDFIDSHHYHTD